VPGVARKKNIPNSEEKKFILKKKN